MKRSLPLSAFRDVAVLFPGDIYELGLFLCKAYDAHDHEANSRNPRVITGPTRPTLHGLAAHYARAIGIELRRVEGVLVGAGFDLGAVVDFAPANASNAAG